MESKEKTKAELIEDIKIKVETANLIIKVIFYRLLETSNKSRLTAILKKVCVSSDGNDISFI